MIHYAPPPTQLCRNQGTQRCSCLEGDPRASHPPGSDAPPGQEQPPSQLRRTRGGRAGADYGYAFAHFLHEFYLYRQASFFAEEPSRQVFDQRQRSFLAAMAELQCHKLFLPVPHLDRKRGVLQDEWDWVRDIEGFNEQFRARVDRRRKQASPEFRRHNILYEGRNLLRL